MNFVKSLRTLAILLIGVLYGSNAVGSPNVGYQVERDLAFINHSSAGFGISLPTTRANPTPLVKLPDLSQTLSDQAQVSSATTAAGAAVFSTIGDIAQGRQQDAAARAQDAQQRLNANPTDPQAQADLAQANRDAAYWREGGPGKTILHGAGGLVLGGPGGASGAIANEQLLPTLIAGSKQMYPDPVPTGNKAADDKAWEEVNARRADYLKTGSLVVGVATGGTTGGSVAQTATQSNYLSHNRPNLMRLSEREQYDVAVASCANGNRAACDKRDELAATSKQRDADLTQACANPTTGSLCNQLKNEAIAMGNTVTTTPSGFTYANSPVPTPLNVATIGSPSDPRTGSFHFTTAQGVTEGLIGEVLGAPVVAAANVLVRGGGAVVQLVRGGVGEVAGSAGGAGGGTIANVRAISAEEANAPFLAKGWGAPYDAGSQVRTFTTTSEIQFVRVSTVDNPQGAFLVRADEVAGMTPQQIQQYLALPKIPTQIADVTVPAGTNMQVGQVAAQPNFGVASKGGIQYQLLNPIPASSFGTPRPFK